MHSLLGYDEEGHVIFISKDWQLYMIELKSMQFKHLYEIHVIDTYHPYRSFYTSGNSLTFQSGIPFFISYLFVAIPFICLSMDSTFVLRYAVELMQTFVFSTVSEVSKK